MRSNTPGVQPCFYFISSRGCGNDLGRHTWRSMRDRAFRFITDMGAFLGTTAKSTMRSADVWCAFRWWRERLDGWYGWKASKWMPFHLVDIMTLSNVGTLSELWFCTCQADRYFALSTRMLYNNDFCGTRAP